MPRKARDISQQGLLSLMCREERIREDDKTGKTRTGGELRVRNDRKEEKGGGINGQKRIGGREKNGSKIGRENF